MATGSRMVRCGCRTKAKDQKKVACRHFGVSCCVGAATAWRLQGDSECLYAESMLYHKRVAHGYRYPSRGQTHSLWDSESTNVYD